MHLLNRRLLAILIDIVIILIYSTALLMVTMTIYHYGNGGIPQITNPLIGQLIGLATLTIPAFLYFYLSEKGLQRATFGKRRMGIRVAANDAAFAPPQHIFIRNLLKLLPWELAHIGVHQLLNGWGEQTITFIFLIVPQVVVLAYVASMIVNKGESSLYDKWAHTKIVREADE